MVVVLHVDEFLTGHGSVYSLAGMPGLLDSPKMVLPAFFSVGEKVILVTQPTSLLNC